jgi:hypothetical protein
VDLNVTTPDGKIFAITITNGATFDITVANIMMPRGFTQENEDLLSEALARRYVLFEKPSPSADYAILLSDDGRNNALDALARAYGNRGIPQNLVDAILTPLDE